MCTPVDVRIVFLSPGFCMTLVLRKLSSVLLLLDSTII